MAAFPKIADNEMHYFQDKARQLLLLKKEDREWNNFCKKVAPECAACLAEKTDSKESKDIGIQAFPKKTFNKIERTTVDPKYQNERIPEALNSIKTRLEKIDFALCKIYDASYESDMQKEPGITSTLHNENYLKSLEEQKRKLIQNSLKTSLEKAPASYPRIAKHPPPAVKLKNPSFVLPYDLQVKRTEARKAYLRSLQTEPKVSFKKVDQNDKKNVQINKSKRSVPKHASKTKPKKKSISKKGSKELSVEEETLIANTGTEEPKDENIEHVVDGILEDLLGEAALDFNRVKHGKRHIESNAVNSETNIVKNKSVPLDSLTSAKNTEPKVLLKDDKSRITKLFFDSPKKDEQKNKNSKIELADKCTNTFPVEDPKNVVAEISANKRNMGTLHKKYSEIKYPPKFVCGVSTTIAIDQEKSKDIFEHKERFWKYLKNISRRVKGNFNPWILNETLAEAILDDCIKEIAEELSEMPSTFIQDLYNQEFVQQVED